MEQVAEIVKAEGKRPVVWDETWINTPQIPSGAIVQIWEDPKLAPVAVAAGHDVLYSPTGGWYNLLHSNGQQQVFPVEYLQSWAHVGGPRIHRFGPLGIEVEKQGFRTVRLITGQKFP